MKFFSTVIAFSALAGVALASPQRGGPGGGYGRPPPPPPPPAHTAPSKPSEPASSPSSSSAGHDDGHGASTTAGGPPVATTTTAAAVLGEHGPSTTTTVGHGASTTTAATTTTSVVKGTVTCLSSAAATSVVNGFASLLTAYTNATAEALLADDFTDTSDSINFLAGNPLGSVTFPSKLAFELGQGTQPAIGFELLNIDAITCTVIAFRWEAILGTASPVKGINILYTENPTQTENGWQIQSVFSEFNSGLWTTEIGGTCVPPSQARRLH
ncbi:hypothetical protein AYL99_04084 [Fonsecaea erecta]|uniref:NTF2-like domain-containing protein n=1 Tax=Fonsecaea erecta TaxID=1367422 RepID=A0A178ZQZ3_9EURO|nr:hypothetical protein AYL99_04084 [Fonsecaea erecta]OAP61881.1 hypothetical protein AYL99_04084 [Fonsecaea erecta]